MNDLEYESTLVDRIAKIQAINEQYDLLNNAYISYSGGKDSDIVSLLIDKALPGNKIPRLHMNTGVEYRFITEHVKEKAKTDSRFIIIITPGAATAAIACIRANWMNMPIPTGSPNI